MIGDRDLDIAREGESTTWLTDLIWTSARRLGHERHFLNDVEPIGGDDHFPFLEAGVPAVDIIDFDYPAVAHGRRHAGQGQRPKPADCRGRAARRAAGYRAPAGPGGAAEGRRAAPRARLPGAR